LYNRLFVIDADGHIIDREGDYRERLPVQYRQRLAFFPSDAYDRGQNGTINMVPIDVEQNLRDNRQQGIDVQVLYPTAALNLTRVLEHDYAVALARAYNDYVTDWCSADRERLKAVAVVPLHVDTRAAMLELERAVGKLGCVGVMINTYAHGRNVAHADFWPFYEECARQGVAVAFHASGGNSLLSVSHFDTFLGTHTLSHAPEQLIACTAVMYSGLLEAYQDLRVAFLEAGCGWAPFWMEHMDEEYEKRPFDAPRLSAPPSEYMRSGRVYVACEPEEKTLPFVQHFFPDDNILFASDYPHWDCGFPDSVSTLADRIDIAETTKVKILSENPRRFYGRGLAQAVPESREAEGW
jgi:predicted TIM-barrel fold metal-dependent hydrolase